MKKAEDLIQAPPSAETGVKKQKKRPLREGAEDLIHIKAPPAVETGVKKQKKKTACLRDCYQTPAGRLAN